jgi:hypothetical protein
MTALSLSDQSDVPMWARKVTDNRTGGWNDVRKMKNQTVWGKDEEGRNKLFLKQPYPGNESGFYEPLSSAEQTASDEKQRSLSKNLKWRGTDGYYISDYEMDRRKKQRAEIHEMEAPLRAQTAADEAAYKAQAQPPLPVREVKSSACAGWDGKNFDFPMGQFGGGSVKTARAWVNYCGGTSPKPTRPIEQALADGQTKEGMAIPLFGYNDHGQRVDEMDQHGRPVVGTAEIRRLLRESGERRKAEIQAANLKLANERAKARGVDVPETETDCIFWDADGKCILYKA